MGSLKKKSNYSSVCFPLLLPSKYAGPKYASLNAMIFFFFSLNLAAPQGKWDLTSLTRGGTCALCSGNAES